MKVLINNNFKALRRGEFVSANSEAGEFIMDTENSEEMTVATLQEVCLANKIEFGKKDKKSDLLSKIETGLIKLPEQSKMSETQKVKEIIVAGVAAGKSDDEMLIEIVTSGIPFKLAGRLFKKEMEEGGHRISASKRKESIEEILAEAEFEPATYQEVSDMVARIVKEVNDTDDKQAMKAIKAYMKEKELEVPKPEKGEAPRGGLRSRFCGWFSENPAATDDDIRKWFGEQGKTSDETDFFMFRFHQLISIGRACAAKCVADGLEPAAISEAPKNPRAKEEKPTETKTRGKKKADPKVEVEDEDENDD